MQDLQRDIETHSAGPNPPSTSCRYHSSKWLYNEWSRVVYLNDDRDADIKVSNKDGGSQKIGHVDGKVIEVCVSRSGRLFAVKTATSSATHIYVADITAGTTRKVASFGKYNPPTTKVGNETTGTVLFSPIRGFTSNESQVSIQFQTRTETYQGEADEPTDSSEKSLGTTFYSTKVASTFDAQHHPGQQTETVVQMGSPKIDFPERRSPAIESIRQIDNPTDSSIRAVIRSLSITGIDNVYSRFSIVSTNPSVPSSTAIHCDGDSCAKASWSPDGTRIVFFGGTKTITSWSAANGARSIAVSPGITITAVVWLTSTRVAVIRGVPATYAGKIDVVYVNVDSGASRNPHDSTYYARPVAAENP